MLVVEKTVPFTSERVCKIQFMSEICNLDPMLTLHVAGLRVYIGENVIVKSWDLVWGERAKVPIPEEKDTITKNVGKNVACFVYHKIPYMERSIKIDQPKKKDNSQMKYRTRCQSPSVAPADTVLTQCHVKRLIWSSTK